MLGLMPEQSVDLGETNFVVATDNDFSVGLDFRGWRGSARRISLHLPATMTASVTVQVSFDNQTTWNNLQRDGADITIAAGDTEEFENTGFDALRLAGTNEAVNRTIVVMGRG